ncbi:hypothetical protein PRUPE_2G022600 [Prunus persica]|uniref:Uncharacterized protein n=1 Tax=Prunus persica TaxID=3760 RepID=A0A251Q9V8_PRUPE|nr:hypothetical protein PRUPE_2G022600 [Prunus persica]
MDTLSDIRALMLNVNQDLAVVSIKANMIWNKSNRTAGVTYNFLIVHFGFGCNLSKDHDHVGLGASLTGNFAVGILLKAGIKNCIRNLITEFIRVSLIHRLRSKQESVQIALDFHSYPMHMQRYQSRRLTHAVNVRLVARNVRIIHD